MEITEVQLRKLKKIAENIEYECLVDDENGGYLNDPVKSWVEDICEIINEIEKLEKLTDESLFELYKMSNDETLNVTDKWIRCKSCEHIKKYKQGARMYCEKQPNRSCLHGFKKIKPTDNICPMFEAKII